MADDDIGGDGLDLNTDLRPRFFFLDIGASVTLPILIFHVRFWTAGLVLLSFVLFIFLETRGIRPLVLFQIIRLRVGGLFRWPINISRRRYYARRKMNR